MNRLLIYILCLLSAVKLTAHTGENVPAADSASDSLVVSLVTCSPGEEAYEVYGHTALRVQSLAHPDQDFVFNYGVFSFNEDYFLWRWLLGETDYSTEMAPYELFERFYTRQGRTVTVQPLSLTAAEARRAAELVMADMYAAREQGWTYRYNFFYDNCTTRALDIVEKALGDSAHIEWPQLESQTLRQMLHQFATPRSPWMSMGQDFLLGTEVDKPATMRQQLFSPIWASHYASQAFIVRADGSRTPLSAANPAALPGRDPHDPFEWPACIIGLLIIASAFYNRFNNKWWRLRAVVHFLQGLIGLLVTFLFLCSTHPAVDSNWLVTMFNPLWLVAAWYIWRHHGKIQGYSGWCYLGALAISIVLVTFGKLAGQEYPFIAVLLYIYFLISLPNHDKAK